MVRFFRSLFFIFRVVLWSVLYSFCRGFWRVGFWVFWGGFLVVWVFVVVVAVWVVRWVKLVVRVIMTAIGRRW